MTAENHGLEIIKPATKLLGVADLPANWRDHIEVVKGRRSKIRVNEIAEDDQDPFEALASSRKIIPLDDSHKAQIEALQRSGCTTLWVADHHLLQTHTCGPQGVDRRPGGQGPEAGRHLRDQLRRPGSRHAQLLPLPAAQRGLAGLPLLARHRRGRHLDPGRPGLDHLLLQPLPGPGDRLHAAWAAWRREQGGYVFTSADAAIQAAKSLGRRPHAAGPMSATAR